MLRWWPVSSDRDLLNAWADGDRDAGDALIERHFESVYRFFRSKIPDEVHDLVQETFLRCMEARHVYEGRSEFRAFVFGVARRVLYTRLRAKYRDRTDLESVSAADLGTSPSRHAVRREEHRVLLEALRHLPVEQQLMLELSYWEGLGGAELAQVLECNPATARTRLHRARLALAQKVQALTSSPRLLQSTLDDLDRWAQGVRRLVDERP